MKTMKIHLRLYVNTFKNKKDVSVMSTLLLNKTNLIEYEITYSKNISRPSKTLVNPNLFNLFSIVKIDPYNDIKEDIITECLNYLNDNFTLENEIESECDYILIDYICLHEMYTYIYNCNYNSNVVIKINDIYNYPKIQFIKLMSMIFSSVVVSVSSYKNTSIIVCTDKIQSLKECKQINIKDFNVKVDQYIINFFYDYNLRHINKILYINNVIQGVQSDIIYTELKLINGYINSFINKRYTCCDCLDIHISNICNCVVCKRCFRITLFNHFLDFQASEADLNAFL